MGQLRAILFMSWAMGVLLSALALPAYAQAVKPLSKAERIICQDLDMCVDLLLRHDASEFDYDILAAEFRRLGPKARGRLIGLVAGRREVAAMRAQDVLLQTGWQFTPKEQSEIAKFWPRGDIQKHAKIMQRIGSPMMRNRAIETLLHKDVAVRDASRLILRGRAVQSDFAMPPQGFAILAKAAMNDPTPEIVTLLAKYPPNQSRPVLQRILLSGEAASVQKAYEALYEINPEMAFENLLSTLRKIDQPQQAFAISELLNARHADRKDGFYLKFAADLAADESFPMLARVAGIDALMQAPPPRVQPVKPGPESRAAFAAALQQDGIDLAAYRAGFLAKTGDEAPAYLALIWGQIKDGYHPQKHKFVEVAATIKDPKALEILKDGLQDKADWRVTQKAALALGTRRVASSKRALDIMAKTHPILDVRAAALTALAQIETGKGDYTKARQSLFQARDYCAVEPHDFRDEARQLPYFDTGMIALRGGEVKPAPRSRLASAVATKSGWLAGYDLGQAGGGLMYYDNKSGDAQSLSDQNILAIIPTRKVPLGQYATQFWVVSASPDGENLLQRLVINDAQMALFPHAVLPAKPVAINVAKDQSVSLSFADIAEISKLRDGAPIPHPPLRLLPDGGIIPACQSSVSVPANAKALPQ